MASVLCLLHRTAETSDAIAQTRRCSWRSPFRIRITLRSTESWQRSTTWRERPPYLRHSTSMSSLELSWQPSECTNYSLKSLHVVEVKSKLTRCKMVSPVAQILWPTHLLIHSMQHSPSWEANRFLATQEISHILWNPKVHYRIHKCPPPVPILSQLDPVHTPPHPTSWRSILILSSHLRLGLPSGLFTTGFSHQKLVYASLLPHTCCMPRPSHSSRFRHPNNIGWGIQMIKLLTVWFSLTSDSKIASNFSL